MTTHEGKAQAAARIMGRTFVKDSLLLDDCPEDFNFTDPVESVFMNPEVIIPGPGEEVISRKGQTLDRNVFETMRQEYYELRGWDAESGLQKIETLERIGLAELVKDLRKMDLIAAEA